jgi:hypothetical protein
LCENVAPIITAVVVILEGDKDPVSIAVRLSTPIELKGFRGFLAQGKKVADLFPDLNKTHGLLVVSIIAGCKKCGEGDFPSVIFRWVLPETKASKEKLAEAILQRWLDFAIEGILGIDPEEIAACGSG